MTGVEVLLTPWEFYRAVEVANLRMAAGNRRGFNNARTYERDYLERMRQEIIGACGELAVCKVKNWYWQPLEELDRFKEVADIGANIEVRSTELDHGKLTVYDGDPLDRWYVLVTGIPPKLVVRGGIRGHAAIRDEWKYPKPVNRDSWLVPQDELAPFRMAIPTEEHHETQPETRPTDRTRQSQPAGSTAAPITSW